MRMLDRAEAGVTRSRGAFTSWALRVHLVVAWLFLFSVLAQVFLGDLLLGSRGRESGG